MAVSHNTARALNFLRKKYKVSERDLVGLAKKLKEEEEPEETWDEITQRYLRNRRLRQFRRNR